MSTCFHIGEVVIEPALLNASGAFDITAVDEDWRAPSGPAKSLGAYVTKTVTLEPRTGNPHPWYDFLEEGHQGAPDRYSVLNSVGLANPGIHAVASEWSWLPDELGMPIILSLGGCNSDQSPGEVAAWITAAEVADTIGWADAIELNLSCPNVAAVGEYGGELAAGSPERTHDIVSAVCSVTSKPVIAKLTAACSSPAAVAVAAERAGASAVTAINTMPSVMYRDGGPEPLLGSLSCGLSGTALHPIALHVVHQVSSSVSIPVIGCGGVGSRKSARRMLNAGASAVAVGTAGAVHAGVLVEIAEELACNLPANATMMNRHVIAEPPTDS